MKNRVEEILYRLRSNPVLIQSARSLKPTPNLWGVVSILLFFIIPEMIGFYRGKEIAQWAHSMALQTPEAIGRSFYWLLEKFFEDGGSWINLIIGIVLLFWLVYEYRR